jgi:hypothetical protein
MKVNMDLLLKLAKVSGNDVTDGLSALEEISSRASSIAKNFGELVGQVRVVVEKAQSISRKMDSMKKEY